MYNDLKILINGIDKAQGRGAFTRQEIVMINNSINNIYLKLQEMEKEIESYKPEEGKKQPEKK